MSEVKIKEESNDLKHFLDSFSPEFDDAGRSITIIPEQDEDDGNVTISRADGEDDDEDICTYYVDQSGNYYYQDNSDSEPKLANPPENIRKALQETQVSEVVSSLEPEKKIHRRKTKQTQKEEYNYVVLMDDDKTGIQKDGVYDLDDTDMGDDMLGEMVSLVKIKKKTSDTSGGDEVFQCTCCEYVTTKRYLLSRHMKCHSDDRPYKCSVCERGFKTQASLQNHVNTHTGNKPHGCKFCQSTFTTSGELVRHVRYKHTHERPHKCTECDYASVELSKLKRHIRCHTGERPYQCPHCTYASPDTFKLKRHLRIHTGEKPYECDICNARFTQSNSLKAHRLIHSVGEKPVFQCSLCPTTCGRKTDLRIHVQKLHTSDTPIMCKRCGQSCPDRYTYKVHSKSHEGEKCYKCDLCPYASISQRHLDSHMLIHTDQKPFVCVYCQQAFRQMQLLKRHMNVYHRKDYVAPAPRAKVHKCPHCARAFSHKGNLIRHMAVHDPQSGTKEERLALKLGREKRIHVVADCNDEQEIEMDMEEEEPVDEEEFGHADDSNVNYIDEMLYDENEEEEGEEDEVEEVIIKEEDDPNTMSIEEDDDGQQYVVLEVVQCDEDEDDDEDEEQEDEYDDKPVVLNVAYNENERSNKTADAYKHQDDMSNCFGFDEDEISLESDDEEGQGKEPTIKIEIRE